MAARPDAPAALKIIAISWLLASITGGTDGPVAALFCAWLNSVMTRRAMELRIWSTSRSSLLFQAHPIFSALQAEKNLFFVSVCLLRSKNGSCSPIGKK
jgi:hypothetical protein